MSRIVAACCLPICVAVFSTPPTAAAGLRAEYSREEHKISVYRAGVGDPILVHNVRPDFRPFLHPIAAPDGQGVVTEFSPSHHKHQTGIYWGFTRVNGRDYFHHPEGDYWRRVSAELLPAGEAVADEVVRWRTVYDLLSANGKVVLRETQTWTMRDLGSHYLLDLEWLGDAHTHVTIGRYDYGGLFMRMPWRQEIVGEAVNDVGQRNEDAEGQRARWVDVGIQVAGRSDQAHIAVFDHPENVAFPHPYRVDGQLGVGPVQARLGDWHIARGETATVRYRLFVYTGDRRDKELDRQWRKYADANDGEQGTTRFVRFSAGGAPKYGVVHGDKVAEIAGDIFGKWMPTHRTHRMNDVRILVPTQPTKVFALAGNYQDHIGDSPPPGNPEPFFKPPSCLLAHEGDIRQPADHEPVHYEAELVVVVGRRAQDVSVDDALQYVLGVTCGNDVSARVWQHGDENHGVASDVQWWRAKGADTFGPCGPLIVAGLDYDQLDMQLRVNGEVRQQTNTRYMIHGVADTVSFLSRYTTLEPGDLIFMGTPGDTFGLEVGDVVEVEIEGVGVLRNRVK